MRVVDEASITAVNPDTLAECDDPTAEASVRPPKDDVTRFEGVREPAGRYIGTGRLVNKRGMEIWCLHFHFSDLTARGADSDGRAIPLMEGGGGRLDTDANRGSNDHRSAPWAPIVKTGISASSPSATDTAQSSDHVTRANAKTR